MEETKKASTLSVESFVKGDISLVVDPLHVSAVGLQGGRTLVMSEPV